MPVISLNARGRRTTDRSLRIKGEAIVQHKLYFNGMRAGLLLALGALACKPDLNITNPNNPDVARAIATPGDVRNLIGTSYNTAYLGMQGSVRPYPGIAAAVMADN